VPFDERRAVVPNAEGRVLDGDAPLPGTYVVGWIKRGPSGVIGTNKPDSLDTVSKLIEDVPTLAACPEPSSEGIRAALDAAGVRVVSFADWKKIDAAELANGAAAGKSRERFTRVSEMLAVLD
jgi:ferredoxin--NADP+ reductase